MSGADNGSVVIKNISGSTYTIVELGGLQLAPGAQLDLCDSNLPAFYADYHAAYHLTHSAIMSHLYADIAANKVQVVSTRAPF